MGDISLPADETVTRKARILVEQGLRSGGYRVTDDPNAPNSVADESTHTAVVRGYGRNLGQVAKDGNWLDAYTPAFEDFVKNLGSAVDQLGLLFKGAYNRHIPGRSKEPLNA